MVEWPGTGYRFKGWIHLNEYLGVQGSKWHANCSCGWSSQEITGDVHDCALDLAEHMVARHGKAVEDKDA